MKKSILFLFMMLAVCSLQAQSIRKGDTFWSGKVLYTATVTPMDEVMLNGVDTKGAKYAISLLKVGKGEYELKAVDESKSAPYGCYYGARVRLMKRQDITLLAFYVAEEEIGQVLVRTPEDLPTLAMQQHYAEQADILECNSEMLLNQKLLSTVKPETLDIMIALMTKKTKTFIDRTNAQMAAFAESKQLFNKDLEPWMIAPPQSIETIINDKKTNVRPEVKKNPVHIVDMDDIEEDTTSVKIDTTPIDLGLDDLTPVKVKTTTIEEPDEDDEDDAEKPVKVKAPKMETPKVETPVVVTPEVETPKVEAPKVEAPKVETPEVETPKVETPAVPETPETPAAAKNPLKKLKKL